MVIRNTVLNIGTPPESPAPAARPGPNRRRPRSGTSSAVKLPAVDYVSPRSVEETIRLLDRHGDDARLLSGGQSLMPMLAFRLAACGVLIDLQHVPGLDGIVVNADGVELGARVRWRDIERDPRLRTAHPLLAAAVAHIAHYQIRNRGTVGGSLAHADPAAELPAVAVTCDAQIVVLGPGGRRTIPAGAFFRSALVTALDPRELIVALRLPPWPPQRRFGFQEFARRRGDFALAGVAAFYDLDARGAIVRPHVGAFGVADTPLRLHDAEQALEGAQPGESVFTQAAEVGVRDIEARSDIHADGDYRRALLGTLLSRALKASMGSTPS